MIIYSNYSVLNLFIPIMGRSLTHESEVVTHCTTIPYAHTQEISERNEYEKVLPQFIALRTVVDLEEEGYFTLLSIISSISTIETEQ